MSTRVDFEEAWAALDLEQRLREIPETAANRGIFFNQVENQLARRGIGDAVAARAILGAERKSYGFYPSRDLVELYARAGTLVSPRDPAEGIRSLFTGTPEYFVSTWYGRAFSRYLRPDPAAAMAWIERSREHFANYGYWRIEHRSKGHLILHMVDEYFWIESAQRGGCEGLLLACGVDGEVSAELDSRFRGRLTVRWERKESPRA